MRAEIILKHAAKDGLLASAARNSQARSVLNRAEPRKNQPQLVTISCDEQEAVDILTVARRQPGSTWRVMHIQMKRPGLLKSILNER